jgi:hypothetical protein
MEGMRRLTKMGDGRENGRWDRAEDGENERWMREIGFM